jgi:hypothetical protein
MSVGRQRTILFEYLEKKGGEPHITMATVCDGVEAASSTLAQAIEVKNGFNRHY